MYRLKHEDELLDLGLLDLSENGITIIEWPEVAENFLPYQNLRLYFGFEAKQRYVEIDADEKLQEYFN